MKQYHKIQTVFLRDPETKFKTLLEGQFAKPEFEYLKGNEWVFTEKVDGTNIRVFWQPQEEQPVRFGGKTDKAQLYVKLIDRLNEMFTYEKMEFLGTETEDYMCLYGEGYGARIQKGGGNYISDGVDFVLFDVRIGNLWLKREDVEDIADKIGIRVVPIIGTGTLKDMVEMARKGLNSSWGNFEAEGIVARPKVELIARNGDRVITKIKSRDFK